MLAKIFAHGLTQNSFKQEMKLMNMSSPQGIVNCNGLLKNNEF